MNHKTILINTLLMWPWSETKAAEIELVPVTDNRTPDGLIQLESESEYEDASVESTESIEIVGSQPDTDPTDSQLQDYFTARFPRRTPQVLIYSERQKQDKQRKNDGKQPNDENEGSKTIWETVKSWIPFTSEEKTPEKPPKRSSPLYLPPLPLQRDPEARYRPRRRRRYDRESRRQQWIKAGDLPSDAKIRIGGGCSRPLREHRRRQRIPSRLR